MFIPRHPVVENQFCSYASQTDVSTGIGGVLCYAGAVLYLDKAATNEEAIVKTYTTFANEPSGSDLNAFGFSMQKVKTGYHQVHPAGFTMPGDLGSSDVIAQPSYSAGAINGTKEAPLGVAHLGIWDTVHYTSDFTGDYTAATAVCAAISPGDGFAVACDMGSRITNSTTSANNADVDGEKFPNVTPTAVARCVKGASIAKVSANVNNTTLYPIRIKLLI